MHECRSKFLLIFFEQSVALGDCAGSVLGLFNKIEDASYSRESLPRTACTGEARCVWPMRLADAFGRCIRPIRRVYSVESNKCRLKMSTKSAATHLEHCLAGEAPASEAAPLYADTHSLPLSLSLSLFNQFKKQSTVRVIKRRRMEFKKQFAAIKCAPTTISGRSDWFWRSPGVRI